MNNLINYSQIVERMDSYSIKYHTLPLHNGYSIIVTQRGGRVFGPFPSIEQAGVLWVNNAFKNHDGFEAFIASNDWNLGGDRMWVAPEIPMFTKRRADFYATTSPQPSLDPGQYMMQRDKNGISLSQDVNVEIYESEIPEKSFRMERHITPSQNPLRMLNNYASVIEDVAFCGYQQTITIKDTSQHYPMYLEAWNLSQVNPGGCFYIPYNGAFDFVDYYDAIDNGFQQETLDYIKLKATGDRRYKVGYPSAILTGRAGYLLPLENELHCLFVKNYYNNPSSVYCCEPFDKPGKTGCSMFVYNDSGELGGFTEFEATCQTLGKDTLRTQSTDSIDNWFFYGKISRLSEIAQALMGSPLI